MAVSHPQLRVREGDRIGTTPDGMIGRVLGDRYRVLSRLGEGGMGTVYLCEHVVLRRRFALKVLRPELGDDPELVERFRNEAIAASRIGQENVVDVVDFGAEEDGALYYVMEALDGRSIGTILRTEGPFPLPRALALLEQTCRALAAAHANGVVHRDVKPENVFVVRREDLERVKILDFGISHVPQHMTGSRITRAGSIIGTPEYMAPEQANGEVVDARADVYAVGVLAFEMVTGMLPFEANGPIAMAVAHRQDTPDPPSRRRAEIPPEVDRLVLKALAKRPEDRFASMLDLAAELARLRAGLYGAGETPDPLRGKAPTMRYEPARRSSRPSHRSTLAVGEPIPEADPRPTVPRGLRGVTRRAWLAVAAVAVTVAVVVLLRSMGGPARPPEPATTAALQAPASEPEAAPMPAVSAPVEIGPVAEDRPALRAAPAPEPASVRAPAKAPPRSAPARAARQAPPKPAQEPSDPYGDELKPDPFK